MKKFLFNPLLLISIINEVCGNDAETVQNTGGKKQCLESAVRTYALAKESFSFDDLAAMKGQDAWDAAKTSKDVVVFYDVEELEPNNTESIIKNGRFADYNIKDAVKGVNYTHYLATCSHEAVKSYENSAYTRIFRISEDNEVLCEVQDDGSIKGEPLTSFIVGVRDDAPADGTPSTKVYLKFNSYKMSIVIPDFDLTDYEGIYDVNLTQVEASATSIKVTASADCSGSLIKSFVAADFIVKDASGQSQTVTLVPPSAEGVYELTGTGFASGFTVELNGVIAQTGITYEGNEALTIEV